MRVWFVESDINRGMCCISEAEEGEYACGKEDQEERKEDTLEERKH